MFRIPLSDGDDLMWGYFVFEAARGGVSVPAWVLLAVPPVVEERLGIAEDDLSDEHVDELLGALPDDPSEVMGPYLAAVGLPVPEPGDEFRLEVAPRGSFRDAVGFVDLLHDAALDLRQQYGAEHFYACTEALEDPADWDARAAVSAMLYLLIIAEREPDPEQAAEQRG